MRLHRLARSDDPKTPTPVIGPFFHFFTAKMALAVLLSPHCAAVFISHPNSSPGFLGSYSHPPGLYVIIPRSPIFTRSALTLDNRHRYAPSVSSLQAMRLGSSWVLWSRPT